MQFHDRDSRNAALAVLSGKVVKSRSGAVLNVERTKTQLQIQRNFHFYKAKDMLSAKFPGRAVSVATEMPVRKVIVDTIFMFEQNKEDVRGSFLAAAADMTFAK